MSEESALTQKQSMEITPASLAWLNALSAAVYVTDAEGLLTHFNPAAVELSGREPRLGSDSWCVSWKLYSPDGEPMPLDECPMAVALQEGRSIKGAEIIVERPDGERIWCEAYPTPLRDEDGKVSGGINMLLDISERKRHELGMRQSEAELSDLFENATVGIHHVGPDGTILHANQAELSLLGYARDEYVGRHIAEFHAEQEAIEEILRRLKAGEEMREYEAPLRCKDGSIRHVLISSNVRWEDDEFLYTRCFTTDITERKEAEIRAEKARVEAEEANRAKAHFLATMSHELRTPLNAIIGYTDLLSAEIGGPVTTDQRRHLDRVDASARHLLHLIEEVLNYSRIEAGREEITIERTDIGELVRSTVELVDPLAMGKGLSMEIAVPDGLSPIDTDPAKVRQILLNLLSNAIKFTEEGSVRVEVLDGSGDELLLHVIDSGVGISADQRKYIFKPFSQGARSLSERPAGTGLGLSVSRHLAQMLGGELDFESIGGEGTTFTLHLPYEPTGPSDTSPES